jgi:hypothetical protein
LDNISVGPI